MAKYLRKGTILLRIDECVDCNECIDCKEKTEILVEETISTNTVITDFEEEIVDKTKKKKKKNEKEDK